MKNERSDLQSLLKQYQSSHLNPINSLIHKICVPLILFSGGGGFYYLSILKINFAICFFLLIDFYYFKLSKKLGLVMLTILVFFFFMYIFLDNLMGTSMMWIYLFIFLASWIGQFIGHHIEGKRPSFLEDLRFLLIGPLWVVNSFVKK